MRRPVVSIVIPTYNSENILEVALKGVANQKCSKEFHEVIIADNNSTDSTDELAKKYGARIVKVGGKPPQVCRQRNIGTKKSRGDYVLFLDHDVKLSENLIQNFVDSLRSGKGNIDAWYLPYKNVASSKLLTEIRNLEDEFYLDSVIAAARLVNKKFLVNNDIKFEPELSSGPADWDFDIQLKLAGAKFAIVNGYAFHHEENLSFWKYTVKKSMYIKGSEIYKNKWQKKNKDVYENIVKKQYDPFYRFFLVFFEKNKWRKLLPRWYIYLLFLFTKFMMATVYFVNKARENI